MTFPRRWKRTLRLKPEWQQAKDGQINAATLSAIIASRLKSFGTENDDDHGERLELIEEFELLAEQSEVDPDEEFDPILNVLYDWADRNSVWVETF